MNTLFKRIRAALLGAFGFLLVLSLLLLLPRGASAAEQTENGYLYYAQLTPEAKRFYDAIGEMDESGALKEGNAEYDLVGSGVLTAAQLSSYAQSPDVMVAFGAARDAYYLDHPEVFYIDFSYLSVSVGTKDGQYVATLGTGRADNYYIPGGFDCEEAVDAAISEFSGVVREIVAAAEAAGSSDAEKIEAVNAQLVERVEYSFCSSANENGTTYLDGAAFIRNPYGALVNGKSVCEGYARAFKVIMDELGIPCVLVQGYAAPENGGYEPHMWNYVNVDGEWYGVDVTWNDGENMNRKDYLLRGNALMKLEHIPDGIISEGGFEFEYPALYPYDYGVTVDPNGVSVEGEYVAGESEGSELLYLKVSYNGKSATRLKEEDGRYLVYRYRYESDGDMVWGNWIYYWMDEDSDGAYSETLINSYYQYIQFALIDYAPDGQYYQYIEENITDSHIGEFSEPYVNYAYGGYKAPPYVKSATPENTAPIQATKTYDITVVYDEDLKKKDESQPVQVKFFARSNDAADYAVVSDVVWNEAQPDRITFRFQPSQMYQHRYESYSFYFVNLVGVESEKEPMTVTYLTEQTSVVCNKVFGDGRLYIKSYGQPSLVGTGDLSLTGWTDEDGNFIAENQRSQLMLVATKPTEAQSADMLESAAANASVAQSDILASETFELELDICGRITRIPNGSYMQLAFGFPAGYGPDDAGVTFKVYHFKRDENGNIDYTQTEELDCVITEYGIVVTVTDFSPFAVVALPADKATSQNRNIYARTVGFGGSMSGGIAELAEGDRITYYFTPDSGYCVDRVLLNGEVLPVENNSVTVAYGDLDRNNTLEAYFVAERVVARETREGITVVYPSLQVVAADEKTEPTVPVTPDAPTSPTDSQNPASSDPASSDPTSSGSDLPWIISLIVGVVVLAAVLIAVIILQKRRKMQ